MLINDEESSKEPLLNKNGVDGEIKVKNSLRHHKYFKQLLLIYLFYTLAVMSDYVFSIEIPNVFLNYVNYNFPNLSIFETQSRASYYKSYSDSLPYATYFLFGPLLGILSDKYGRKPIMFIGIGSSILDVVACIITVKTNCLYYFYVSHTFAGISNAAAAAIFSFLKDLSDEDQLPLLYSLLGASIGIGVITGPLIFIGLSSLSLSSSSSSSYIILLVAGGLMILCISIIPFLKESTEIAKLENKINIDNSKNQTLNPFKLIKNLFSNSPFISFVILIYVLMSFSSEDVNTSYYYYSELMYNWGSKENGLYLGSQGVFIIIWGVLIIPILLKYFSPRKTVSIGIGVGIIAHISLVFSGYSKYLWILGSALNANGTNNLSLIQSIVSNSIPYNLQGTIITGTQAIGSMATFLASLIFENIYSYFTANSGNRIYYPQATYALNGLIFIITFLISLIVWKNYKEKKTQTQNEIN
ncbi:hypothetical protein ACTFIW_012461 [Dictyostelium discoideum]